MNNLYKKSPEIREIVSSLQNGFEHIHLSHENYLSPVQSDQYEKLALTYTLGRLTKKADVLQYFPVHEYTGEILEEN